MKLTRIVIVLLLFTGSFLFAGGQSSGGTAEDYGPLGKFPLTKTMTLRGGIAEVVYDPADNPIVQMWEEETNVHIDWVVMETFDKRNILFASDDYPDFSFATGLWKNEIAQWMNEGIVYDLAPLLKQGYTPNLDRIFKKYPQSYAYMLNPDGKLQALAQHWRNESGYLEQNFMINRKWLDRLGLEKPTTTEELKEVLIAFRDRDPNGNGKKDELPMSFMLNDGFAQHIKCMYGIWGLPTKNGIAIDNGVCSWAPMRQGYKDFIKYMADLYAEDLIDPEAFIYGGANRPDFNAKIDNPDGNVYGFIVAVRGFVGTEMYPNRGEFESMSPPQVPGYGKPEVWVHPGYLAIKNFWFMTDKNPSPAHTMAWIDTFYTFERSIQSRWGRIGEGIVQKNGVWVPKTADDFSDPEWHAKNTFAGVPSIVEDDEYVNKLALDPSLQFLYDNYYKYYVDYKADEQWNRPEFTAAETAEITKLRTDIEKLWLEKQAQWITGVADVDTEWDRYVRQFKTMGIDQYVALHQAAYDRFVGSQK